MRVLLQKVKNASVSVDGQTVGAIGNGYLLLTCVMEGDSETDAVQLAERIAGLRLWNGHDGKINDRSLVETGGGILAVSQFTLAGDTRKGRRPDYTAAAKPDVAKLLLGELARRLRIAGVNTVEEGVFGAHMEVSLVNDGPVTLWLDSRQ